MLTVASVDWTGMALKWTQIALWPNTYVDFGFWELDMLGFEVDTSSSLAKHLCWPWLLLIGQVWLWSGHKELFGQTLMLTVASVDWTVWLLGGHNFIRSSLARHIWPHNVCGFYSISTLPQTYVSSSLLILSTNYNTESYWLLHIVTYVIYERWLNKTIAPPWRWSLNIFPEHTKYNISIVILERLDHSSFTVVFLEYVTQSKAGFSSWNNPGRIVTTFLVPFMSMP